MAAPVANSTAKFCCRLFQDTAPRVVAQQALDQMIKADQERFCAKWKFDVNLGTSKNWNIIQTPKATFYTKLPRRLKARRRLTPSMVEKLQAEMKTSTKAPLSQSSLFGRLVFDFSETPEEKDNFIAETSTILKLPSMSASTRECSPTLTSKSATSLKADPVFKFITPLPKVTKRKINPKLTGKFIFS